MAVKQQGMIAKTQGNKSEQKEAVTIRQWIKAMEPAIKAALPAVVTPERFTRIALSAVSNTPELGECTPKSFIAALMNAAQLGLEPNTPLGQAYLIPYRNKGVLECQFQLGYKGIIDLAYRSGDVQTIQAQIVYENDEFEFEFGLESKLVHKPAKSNRGDMVWVYAIFKLVNGGYGFEVMSIDDVRKHAEKYSQAYKSGFSPWKNNFEEMAKKTVIKKVLKYAPIKTEFVRGIQTDETIKTEIDEDMTTIPAEYTVRDESPGVDKETGEITDGMANDASDEPLPWDEAGK
jgi:recombination protein RecT